MKPGGRMWYVKKKQNKWIRIRGGIQGFQGSVIAYVFIYLFICYFSGLYNNYQTYFYEIVWRGGGEANKLLQGSRNFFSL